MEVAFLAQRELIGEEVEFLDLTTDEARRLARFEFARLLAFAIMMPYDNFLSAARRVNYDINILRSRFSVTFSQAAWRLIMLAKHGQSAVPFFIMEIDAAGNRLRRGEAFEFSNEVEKPLVFFTSGKSGLNVEFNSPALTASFHGRAAMLSDVQLFGDASISTPSIPRLYELLFENLPADIPSLGNFLVKGKVSANIHEIQFDESIVELGTNKATGNLIARRSKQTKPKISGTLAFNSLDVTPFIEMFSGKRP
ncbi:unnamed protein product, partial [marine sediment metagenome]